MTTAFTRMFRIDDRLSIALTATDQGTACQWLPAQPERLSAYAERNYQHALEQFDAEIAMQFKAHGIT